MVLICLHAFPKGTSPGALKLQAQHLLDAIAGSSVCSKKGGGIRPIAVGEVLHCLASRLCCLLLFLVFFTYGQVGSFGGCYPHFISVHSRY